MNKYGKRFQGEEDIGFPIMEETPTIGTGPVSEADVYEMLMKMQERKKREQNALDRSPSSMDEMRDMNTMMPRSAATPNPFSSPSMYDNPYIIGDRRRMDPSFQEEFATPMPQPKSLFGDRYSEEVPGSMPYTPDYSAAPSPTPSMAEELLRMSPKTKPVPTGLESEGTGYQFKKEKMPLNREPGSIPELERSGIDEEFIRQGKQAVPGYQEMYDEDSELGRSVYGMNPRFYDAKTPESITPSRKNKFSKIKSKVKKSKEK